MVMDSLLLLQNTDENVILPENINFKYMSTPVAGPGLLTNPNEIVYQGCECVAASCHPDCPCVTRFGTNFSSQGHLIKDHGCHKAGQSQPVFECNASCKCGPACINRVVQNGPSYVLEVFRTEKKGYGLRSREQITKDRFVCEYVGEVLTIDEARTRTQEMQPHDMNFILVVREILSDGKIIQTAIDPTVIGNVGRFINHSCQPNLYLVSVRIDNEIPRVALFAQRDIEAGEELTYSYGGDRTPSGTENDGKCMQQTPCFCASEACHGFLPYDKYLYS